MSSEPGAVDPEDFAGATPDERAAEATADDTDGGGSRFPSLPNVSLSSIPTGKLKPLLKARGDGVAPEDAQERLPVGEAGGHMVAAVTRAVGTDDVPPVAQFCVGCAKALRDRSDS